MTVRAATVAGPSSVKLKNFVLHYVRTETAMLPDNGPRVITL
jgi:hypothetical protein